MGNFFLLLQVILEDQPCSFYFDFDGLPNTFNYKQQLSVLNKIFSNYLIQAFNLDSRLFKVYYLTLDSSTARKNSYHVIFRIFNESTGGECMIKNNRYCGNLIKNFLHFANNILSQNKNKDTCKILNLILDDPQCFIILLQDVDVSVYSKNRCFRLMKSTKMGKNNYLQECIDDVSCLPNNFDKQQETFFRFSLMTIPFIESNVTILQYNKKVPKQKIVSTRNAYEVLPNLTINHKATSNSGVMQRRQNDDSLTIDMHTIKCDCCNRSVTESEEAYPCPEILQKFMQPYISDTVSVFGIASWSPCSPICRFICLMT